MKCRKSIYLIIAGFLFLMSSCYSDYVQLKLDTFHGASWNHTHEKVSFVASGYAYQNAKGISAFPDGGTPRELYHDVGLYILDTASLELTKLVNFNDLIDVLKDRWTVKLVYTDTVLYYKVTPITNWELYFKWADTEQDSIRIDALKDKYQNLFGIELETYLTDVYQITSFDSLAKENYQQHKADLTELNMILSELPVAQWGLKLQAIKSKPESEYIHDLIYVAKGASALTKRAIIEQIVASREEEEIRKIIRKMDKHQKDLEGLKKKEYELYSKESYELIKKLLED